VGYLAVEPTPDVAETKRPKATSRRDRRDRPPDTPPLPPYDWRERWGVWRRRRRESGVRERRWKFGIGELEMRWMLGVFERGRGEEVKRLGDGGGGLVGDTGLDVGWEAVEVWEEVLLLEGRVRFEEGLEGGGSPWKSTHR
jgi:hypothetical protein